MNETQQEPNQPKVNYDFITQQSEPVATSKGNKKIIVILILLPIAILVLIASLMLGQGDGGGTESTLTETGDSNNLTIAEQFIVAMKANEDEYQSQAYELLADNLKTDPALTVNSLVRIRESIDFTSCDGGQVTSEDSQQLTTYRCANLRGRDVSLQLVTDGKVKAYRVN